MNPRRAPLALAVALLAGTAIAQERPPAPATASPSPLVAASPSDAGAVAPATLRVGNRDVVTLRATVLGNPPAERVRAAAARLAGMVDRRVFGPVSSELQPFGRVLMVDGTAICAITPGDVDAERGDSVDAASARATKLLSVAMNEAREARSLPDLLKALGLALLATVVFALVLWAVERSRRRLVALALAAAEGRMRAVGIRAAASFLKTDHVYVLTTRGILLVGRLLDLVVAYVWLAFVLKRFAWTRPWGEHLGRFFLSTLKGIALAAVGWIPSLAVIVIIALATRILVRVAGVFFDAVEDGRIEASPALVETAQPTRKIVSAVIWLFALIMAYPYLPGSSSEAFKGISVMVGLMVSLGSTALVGQLASGFMLMYSRTFRPGHYVRLGDVEGTVISLGLFSTKVRTVKGEEVSIPNAVVVGTTATNFSRTPDARGVILHTSVTIGYDTPWRQVEALLLLAAERTAGLKKDDPRPFVLQRALNDFYVEYEVNAVIERAEERIPVLAALHAQIQDAFNEFGVQIMSPHYLGDPAREKVVPRSRWHDAPAAPDGADASFVPVAPPSAGTAEKEVRS